MALSGNGGHIKIGAATYDIGKWTLNKDPRLKESTLSSNTGTRYKKVITDPSWTIELPPDAATMPEVVGLTEGTVIALLKFKVGESALYYSLVNTTVGPIDIDDDNAQDVVRVRLSGKGGDVSGPA